MALFVRIPFATAKDPSDKFTVCTITINSDNEAKLFKSKLKPPSRFEFVEIVPGRADDKAAPEKTADSENWFKNACAQLKERKKSCDMVILSGHFGGAFFGSSGQRLTLETLEQMGCNSACPGIMNSPKEVFLFGCNTLAGKGANTRTPEQYRAVLRAEVNENGDRVFTDAQVEEVVVFRYGDFGESNRERMSRAFSGVPHLYGFDSVAPSGKNAEESLMRYLKSVPDYAAHLEQVELERATKGMIGALDQVHQMNGFHPPKPNPEIATAFKSTNFAQCSGNFTEDTAGYCGVFDENRPLSARLSLLRGLLAGPGGTKYLGVAKQFFERYPPEKYDAQAKSEFDLIGANPVVKKRFATTLAALEKMPAFALDLNELGEKLSWVSHEDAQSRKKTILAQLLNQGTIEAKDLVCSRQGWPEIPAAEINPAAFTNPYSLEAMTCIPKSNDPEAARKFAIALTANDKDARRLGAWLLGESSGPKSGMSPEIEKKLAAQLNDPDIDAKQMAAWALHRSAPQDPAVQQALAERLDDPHEDASVRRDAAMAFFQIKAKGGEFPSSVRESLEKAAKGGDSIVARIATRALTAHGTGSAEPTAEKDFLKSAVVSHAGVEFEPVKNPKTGESGWRDTVTGKVWYESKNTPSGQYGAEMDCSEKPGQELPSKADLVLAEQHGIRDVLKNMNDHWFWSSSLGPDGTRDAYVFVGYDGGIGYDDRNDGRYSVRCVGR
ncbi:MAG: HEAT repeat domain-containing protein [Deltaproteobacteria bacterium]|nr:HEAT repeat domain-containing protein [Deltaproteobacteria bacterium]